MTLAPDAPHPVYLGIWTNWSRGKVQGSTLTLTIRDGTLLTALTALFVSYIATLLWRIFCLTFFRISSSKGQTRSLPYHQRQLLLRNSSSGAGGLWRSIKLLWHWRGSKDNRELVKIGALMSLCVTWTSIFTVASIFSSKVTSSPSDEVLISSPKCGHNIETYPGVYQPSSYDNTGEPTFLSKSGSLVIRTQRSHMYVPACYEDGGGTLCKTFVKPKLPFKQLHNASCPFDPSVCAVQDRNMALEAHLDIHDDLGFNTPPDSRLSLNWFLACAPLNATGHKRRVNLESNQSFMQYYWGRRIDGNGNYKPYEYTTMEPLRNFSSYDFVSDRDRGLRALPHVNLNGTTDAVQSYFDPIDELKVADAEVWLLLMTSAYALTLSPVDDAWYGSHRHPPGFNVAGLPLEASQLYMSDEEVSTLACKAQMQICKSASNPADHPGCTPKESPLGVYRNQLHNSTFPPNILPRLFSALSSTTPLVGTQILDKGLLGSFGGNDIVEQIVPDIWQRDVVRWFQLFLANLQGLVVDAATGPTPDQTNTVWAQAETAEERRYCLSQKIRSSDHANFSVFWLSFVFALGVLILIIEWSLEPFLYWLDHHKESNNSYALAEWHAYEDVQLQRLVHEELGYGDSWAVDAAIPLCDPKELLAVVDMTDPKHPRLKRKGASNSSTGKLEEGSSTEDATLATAESDDPVETTLAGSQKSSAEIEANSVTVENLSLKDPQHLSTVSDQDSTPGRRSSEPNENFQRTTVLTD